MALRVAAGCVLSRRAIGEQERHEPGALRATVLCALLHSGPGTRWEVGRGAILFVCPHPSLPLSLPLSPALPFSIVNHRHLFSISIPSVTMPSSKLMSFLSLALALAPLASTHFIVNTPAPLGSNIDNEDTVPCGGFTPSTSEVTTNFHVGGDAIGVSTLHAQSSFAYRAMLGQSLSAPNWTVLIPTIQQYGLNNFCEPSIAVPASWVGQAGLMQIIQDAEDGVHYQVCVPLISLNPFEPSEMDCSLGLSD